jgi:Mu-like prophage I protein
VAAELFNSLRIPVVLKADGKAELPTEFKVLANGVTDTLKGPIRCSDYSCGLVLAHMKALGRDKLPFDYNHEMVGFGDGRAAGWFVPASRGGELWATDVEWTPRAKAELDAKEWRYFSPALFRDEEGNITELINIALTNLPATLNQTPLVTSRFEQSKETQDMTLEQLLASAGAKDAPTLLASITGLTAKVAKLEADNAALLTASQTVQTQLNTATAELKTIKDGAEVAKKTALITKLSADGKLPPALHKWAEGQSFAQLEEYGAGVGVSPVKAPAVVPGAAPTVASLTVEELSICKQMKLDPLQFLSAKTQRAAAGGDPKVLVDTGLPEAPRKAGKEAA